MADYGTFSGNPLTEWLVDGYDGDDSDRDMQLWSDFGYTDPHGRIWPAQKGRVINGASIPRPLWSLVGSPYTGAYRRASIVHDIACSAGSGVLRADADHMFYFACLCGGCNLFEAKMLYAGVCVGAWSHAAVPDSALTARRLLFRAPGEKSSAEYSILSKYAEIAEELRILPESATLVQIDAVIRPHLV